MLQTRFLSVITITAGACLMLTACGQDKEVSFKSAGVQHTFSEGEAAKTNNFPLPIYPKAEPSGAVSTQGEAEDHSTFMMLTSADSLDTVNKFYEAKLKEEGWSVNDKRVRPEMINISASKKDLEANVMLSTFEGKTTITLAFSKEPEGEPKVTDKNYVPDKFNPPTD